MKTFKLGNKVEIPIHKSCGCSWKRAVCIDRAFGYNQNYLYVVGFSLVGDLKNRIELAFAENALGEHFLEKDLTLWTEESPTIEEIKKIRSIYLEINGEETVETKG
jgi:hypothetical protein